MTRTAARPSLATLTMTAVLMRMTKTGTAYVTLPMPAQVSLRRIVPRGCRDFDDDGLDSAEDECPNEAGPSANQGCPITGVAGG